jgi:hypothetical protein
MASCYICCSLPHLVELCLFIVVVYILLNVNFYPFDSGGLPAYLRNLIAQFRFFNVFHLTLDHVLF